MLDWAKKAFQAVDTWVVRHPVLTTVGGALLFVFLFAVLRG